MSRWIHSRRGLIEGEEVPQDEESEWAFIRLTADSPRASNVARGHGPIDPAGSVITVRRSFLRLTTNREVGSHDGHRIAEKPTMTSTDVPRFCHTCEIEIEPLVRDA